MVTLLEPAEIERIERSYAAGIPARVVVDIFRPRGLRLSAATFRKYVQAGLLPQSRRIGQKGKHRGSTGVYPVGTVRRINVIKKMMAEGLTLADVRRSFVYFRNEIDAVESAVDRVQADFARELDARPLARDRRSRLRRDLERTHTEARRLIFSLERIGSHIAAAGPVQPAAAISIPTSPL